MCVPLELLPSWTISIRGKLAFLALEDAWYPPSKATPHVRYVVASHRVWHKNCSSQSVARLPRAKSLYTCSCQRWIPNQTTERKFVARRTWGGQPKQPLHLLNYWTILPHPLSSDTLHCINTVTLAILIWTIRCKHANYFRNTFDYSKKSEIHSSS
jgi:hypothetical protein